MSQAGFTHSHDFCKKPSETLIWVEGERSSHFGKCANNELNRRIGSKIFFSVVLSFTLSSSRLFGVFTVLSFCFMNSWQSQMGRFQWRNFSSTRMIVFCCDQTLTPAKFQSQSSLLTQDVNEISNVGGITKKTSNKNRGET